MSLFHVPETVITTLEKLRNTIFFWGETGDAKKIIWANNVMSTGSLEAGGLNIGSLKANILGLLAKWWWRFRTEKTGYEQK